MQTKTESCVIYPFDPSRTVDDFGNTIQRWQPTPIVNIPPQPVGTAVVVPAHLKLPHEIAAFLRGYADLIDPPKSK